MHQVKASRWLTLAAACALGAASLAACSTAQPEPSDDAPVTIRLAHGWVGEVPQAAAFVPAIEDYAADHPEIDLVVEESAGNAIGEKIATQMAAGEEPDVFLHWGVNRSSEYIEAGRVADLTDLLDAHPDVEEWFDPASFSAAQLDGGTYGLPMSTYIHMFLYDEQAFSDAGVGAPETLDDLLDAVPALAAEGAIPLSANITAQRYLFELYVAQLIDDNEELREFAETGEGHDSEVAEAAQAIIDLREAGAFPQGAESLTTLPSLELYNAGQALSYYQDSWTLGNLSPEVADRTVVGLAPAIDASSDVKMVSGSNYFVYMSQKAYDDPAKRDAAWDLMTYLAGPEVAARLLEVSDAPSAIPMDELNLDESEISSVVTDLIEMRDELGPDEIVPLFEQYLSPEALAGLQDLAERLLIGQVGADDVAQAYRDVLADAS